MCRPVGKATHRVPGAPALSNAIGVRAGAIWQENAQLPVALLNREGGTQGNVVKPPSNHTL